ncbi:glycosyltransferase family protein [Rossellomorea aquimaris]|uniref:cytidylyltransferase domain-containing protein n=1 Tax=Rossellomorea aquimaris TaxID=189382 RepID=UPI001CD3CD0C|nr:glycosyltransferase family protein [Rossellomorea aquimaris]MCA1055304.1 glycosyltransferase family protein [Rossellomorea aquimaris]
MKVVCIIQARMNSTRLPGKILKEVRGKTLLEHQLERLAHSKKINQIVVATTNNNSDDKIINICRKLNINSFRGSEEDVLSRYYEAALYYEADAVVRITSDCPLIDPEVVDEVVQHYLENYPSYDLVSNTIKRTFPRGLDASIFSMDVLEEMNNKAVSAAEREHVTKYIYNNISEYQISNVINEHEGNKNHRWTVDTTEDFELIKNIYDSLYIEGELFYMNDVLKFLKDNPDLVNINSHIEQKQV